MKKFFSWAFVCLLVLASVQISQAQNPFYKNKKKFNKGNREQGYYAIGGNIGIINYFGDLNPLAQYVSTDITKSRPSLGISVMKKISPRMMLRGSLSWGRIIGDDNQAANPNDERHRYRYIRNAHFRNDIFELAAGITYDLMPSAGIYYKRRSKVPYLSVGVAAFYHNPMARTPAQYGGRWTYLRPLGTEGQNATPSNPEDKYAKPYSLFQIAIPVGVGMRFKLNDRTDLAVEVGYRITFTDYLDDVSQNYANPNDLKSDLARAMANRTMEQTAIRTGADRQKAFEINDIVLDQRGNPTVAGFGNANDKRGEASRDVYIMSGVHLIRILNTGIRCPKFK